ncbi:peptidase, M14 family, carboxypeptidase A [Formosa agariphila KMM 3901]|uniref:Peptidase, M14 family, carboxypeptidase A n=1 Tax=Formosa agariphila (strain DSM 15362 / KCTC 12365 / LMG 23005 / KMM 3901 / M-2Alg 35-1) TaxID=1347342 RepID=T2KJU6_FORAG|nr:M14 metallopeptidase family protein [Formosa agariphila]CDF79167.1 peptidase, M14 family, carboxypeptidase A [Formosa agariphila KMM 3901]
MTITELTALYETYKEPKLHGRYITNSHIKPLLENLDSSFEVFDIGTSVLGKPISAIKIGTGKKRILLWSQMHGNESTTTKALFDFINVLKHSKVALHLKDTCTFYIIPILNPDGAEAYTRLNAVDVDLNRDAQLLTQPESKVLRAVYDSFKPDFCFNLHGQRTIFSAGSINKVATVSFLSPAQDENRTITDSRKIGMDIIAEMNTTLQQLIPNQVGRYDDSFNINCVGDSFQSFNVPTILFEAGHYANDYDRNQTRFYIFSSYITAFNYISSEEISGDNYNAYFEIPENDKCFYDVIIRNANVGTVEEPQILDVAILFVEKLINGKVEFIPKVDKIELLTNYYGHKEVNANNMSVLGADNKPLMVGVENDFVTIGADNFLLKL